MAFVSLVHVQMKGIIRRQFMNTYTCHKKRKSIHIQMLEKTPPPPNIRGPKTRVGRVVTVGHPDR